MKIGVYFLLKRKKVVYIGHTTIFPIRFNYTNSKYDFDRFRFIECSGRLSAKKYERRLISYFKPIYNVGNNIPTKLHHRTGIRNPNGGRKKFTGVFDCMDVMESVTITKYHPSSRVHYFNRTRNGKELKFSQEKDYFIVTRIK